MTTAKQKLRIQKILLPSSEDVGISVSHSGSSVTMLDICVVAMSRDGR
jgi:hypothetical protein